MPSWPVYIHFGVFHALERKRLNSAPHRSIGSARDKEKDVWDTRVRTRTKKNLIRRKKNYRGGEKDLDRDGVQARAYNIVR